MDWSLVVAMVTIHGLTLLSPGPDNILVISRTTGQGFKYGLATIVGIASAGLIQIPLVAFGLQFISTVAPSIWLVIRVIGAFYLLYVGYKIVMSASSKAPSSDHSTDEPLVMAFVQGFISNLTNPKVLIFVTAFLPQFVAMDAGNISFQLLVLGVIMKANGFFCLMLIALIALYTKQGVARVLDRHGAGNLPKFASGITIIGLGFWMLLEPLLALKRRLSV